MGDLFLESALCGPKNTFIIETHSEHLLLRIMRRIREYAQDTSELGRARPTPDDIGVWYVEKFNGQTIAREMPLNKRGELIKAWPGGFFEEGLREVF